MESPGISLQIEVPGNENIKQADTNTDENSTFEVNDNIQDTNDYGNEQFPYNMEAESLW